MRAGDGLELRVLGMADEFSGADVHALTAFDKCFASQHARTLRCKCGGF